MWQNVNFTHKVYGQFLNIVLKQNMGGIVVDSRKLNEFFMAAKKGDYSKLDEMKDYISDEDYQKALNIYSKYSGKSEDDIIKELAKLKKTVPNQQEIINKIIPFLNEQQKSKLNKVLEMLEEK